MKLLNYDEYIERHLSTMDLSWKRLFSYAEESVRFFVCLDDKLWGQSPNRVCKSF